MDCAWCRRVHAVSEVFGAGSIGIRSKLSTAVPFAMEQMHCDKTELEFVIEVKTALTIYKTVDKISIRK